MALATATSQGAAQGSGLQGGYGQISGQTNTGLLGLNQGLMQGQQNFALNAQVSGARMGIANAGANASFGSSLVSLGGSLMSAASAGKGLLGGYSPSGSTGGANYQSYGSFTQGIGGGGVSSGAIY